MQEDDDAVQVPPSSFTSAVLLSTYRATTSSIDLITSAASYLADDRIHTLIPNEDELPSSASVCFHADSYSTIVDVHDESSPLLEKGIVIEGRSSFVQSCLNVVNLMIGLALLSLPYTLKTGGWIPGLGLIFFFGIATFYTAKILIKCMEKVPTAINLGDVGFAAFGSPGRYVICLLYILELVICSVSYVIIVGDSMTELFKDDGGVLGGLVLSDWKTGAISLMVLSSWFDSAAIMAFCSLMGVLASALLFIITIYDGFFTSGPGSVWEPADTKMFPVKWSDCFINFGLVIFAYSGHSVIPTIYKDMKNPKQFNKMLTTSYSIFMLWFIIIPITCYLMIGGELKQEYTINLLNPLKYNKALNGLLMWIIVIVCLTKYSLVLSPVIRLFSDFSNTVENRHDFHAPSSSSHCFSRKRFIVTTILGIFVWAVAEYYPDFIQVTSFVGAAFSFSITLIFPCICHLCLFWSEIGKTTKFVELGLIVIGSFGSVLGTYACFVADL